MSAVVRTGCSPALGTVMSGRGLNPSVCAAGLKAPATSRAVPASAARPTRPPLGPGTREGAACRTWAPRCGKTLRYAPSPAAPPAASLAARGSAPGAVWTASLRGAPRPRARAPGDRETWRAAVHAVAVKRIPSS